MIGCQEGSEASRAGSAIGAGVQVRPHREQVSDSEEAVAERRRLVRAIVFREYLLDIHSLVSRPRR